MISLSTIHVRSIKVVKTQPQYMTQYLFPMPTRPVRGVGRVFLLNMFFILTSIPAYRVCINSTVTMPWMCIAHVYIPSIHISSRAISAFCLPRRTRPSLSLNFPFQRIQIAFLSSLPTLPATLVKPTILAGSCR